MKRKPSHHRNDSYTQDGPNKLSTPEPTSSYINFHDAPSVRTHNINILARDFNLKLELPDDRLCPPIPNRLAYVTWIQALIDSTSPDYTTGYDPERKVVGLDIGTGASAIYALLALREREGWEMYCTDIDEKSLSYARRNISNNDFTSRTTILQTHPQDPLVPLDKLGVDKLDFTICNPPFFATEKEMKDSMTGLGKDVTPSTICTGSTNEMMTPGGDLAFTTRLLTTSLSLRGRVTWYTTLLGHLSSTQSLITLLRENGITNYAVGVINPTGGVTGTRRWVLGWSFGNCRPRNGVVRPGAGVGVGGGMGTGVGSLGPWLPEPTEYLCSVSDGQDFDVVWDKVRGMVQGMDTLFLRLDEEDKTVLGGVALNVWNRAYRKKKKGKMEGGEKVNWGGGGEDANVGLGEEKVKEKPADSALVFRIKMQEDEKQVCLEWVRGSDQVLWTSFCGWVHRGVREA